MANDEYYSSSYHNTMYANPYHDSPSRSVTPLSTRPPVHSPYNEHNYPYSHQTPAQSYAGTSGRTAAEDEDPFDDGHSIPLNAQKGKHASSTSVSPILPHEMDDPFVRDIDPSRTRPRDQRRQQQQQQDGWFKGKITWVVYTMTCIQLAVFLAEIIKNAILTGSPIEIHPSFNPMIGPSPYVMINMGARYDPCMKNLANVQNRTDSLSWPCPNATSTTGASVTCQLSELCGLGGVPNPHIGGTLDEKPAPDQWFRFIIPMFVHAGIVHIGFNLLLQLTLGRDVERLIGSVRFALVYLSSGIFGFVLGGNFAATGIASCGCSGSLFGILAITLLDLFYTWRSRPKPWMDLLFIVIDMCIAFVLGLLPGLDNFAHIGGFLMGLVLGVCVLRSPSTISQRTSPDYVSASRARSGNDSIREFIRAPHSYVQGRRGVWWAWWLVRVTALVGALIGFILLLKNFYVWDTTCSWCKYLSCLPVTVDGTNWCNVGNLDFTSQ